MITMTPQARAIAVFTLATLLITGHLNRLALAVFAVSGADIPGGRGQEFVMGLLTILVAGAVLWFAHQTVEAGATGWETNLAQAGRFLALVALVIAVLATIATLTSHGPFWGTFSLSF
jgi:hypothetical protein